MIFSLVILWTQFIREISYSTLLSSFYGNLIWSYRCDVSIESLVLCVLVCCDFIYSGFVLCSYFMDFFFYKFYCHEKSEIFCSKWELLCSMKIAAIARTVGHLSKSAEVMKIVNNLMKAPEMATTMQEFSKEMTKVILLLHHEQLFVHSLYW